MPQSELLHEKSGGENAYAALTGEAAKSSLGANGLIALPYFEGERTPLNDPNARGQLFGLSLKHTRGDVYRAILEGVGFGIRHNVEEIRQAGLIPERMVAVGGATCNDLWMQLVADIANIELAIPQQMIGASYGDAFMAAVGLGRFKDLTDIRRWVRTEKVIRPNPAAHKQCAPYYKLFRALYKANPLFDARTGRFNFCYKKDTRMTKPWIEEVFGCRKPIIGMCHLNALPGDPSFDKQGGMQEIINWARRDLLALQNGGIDAVMFSNEFRFTVSHAGANGYRGGHGANNRRADA